MHKLLPTIAIIASLAAVSSSLAQSAAEYDATTGTLVIPQVKVGQTTVYNARLRFNGGQNFQLLGYDTTPTVASPPPDNQVPPLNSAQSLQQWLVAGSYKSWSCEAAAHGPQSNSPHGNVRICSNAALAASTTAPWPVGAASVKELYTGTTVTGYAVGVKIAAGSGANTWHWYESISGSLVANSVGAGICAGCHGTASRDNVFVKVP